MDIAKTLKLEYRIYPEKNDKKKSKYVEACYGYPFLRAFKNGIRFSGVQLYLLLIPF